MLAIFRCCLVLALPSTLLQASDFPEPFDTQKEGDRPNTPEEAAASFSAPDGFSVTLFAGEPDIRQPIGFTIDDAGRLWVVENYTYSGRGYEEKLKDRILIFEDTDRDGRHDERKVFWDQGNVTTSVAVGFGGVWTLNDGKLQFIPDGDRDDTTDSEPETLLEGFDIGPVGHNVVNGLKWGPDGWLYGRHGIQATSLVGPPGSPDSGRTKLNCSIWRFHPVDHTFEVVASGTTNPWGADWNEYGQLFFTNNVIGHLWHVIPGAHYERMYGVDFFSRAYELMGECADHYHWQNNGFSWQASRDISGVHGELGGGHSHCGGMIYLGNNWPEEYRGQIYMCNTHGKRLNRDALVRKGNGYVGEHREDMLFANNPWFRGVDLQYGPDGGVYLSDWTDLGECHDHDGIHRGSGRIYKIVYKEPSAPSHDDVAELDSATLAALQLHANAWFARAARRNLQERALADADLKDAQASLFSIFDNHPEVTRQLRAMWCLFSMGALDEDWLIAQLEHPSEHVRTWAVKLLVDKGAPSDAARDVIAEKARDEKSGLVRLFMASALQRIPAPERWELAEALASHSVDAEDRDQPLMLWYGIEAAVAENPMRAVRFAGETRIPLLRRFIARRLMEDVTQDASPVDGLVMLAHEGVSADRLLILQGMADAAKGWRDAPTPAPWLAANRSLLQDELEDVRALARELSLVFGDGRALEALLEIARDDERPIHERRNAIEVLAEARAPELRPLLHRLANDHALANTAAAALARYDHPDTPRILLNRYDRYDPEGKQLAIATLSTRPEYARELLRAVTAGRIPAQSLSAYHARQIDAFGDAELSRLVSENWGIVKTTPEDKKRVIERYKGILTDEALADADVFDGHRTFLQVCSSCHRLYGEGGRIGPDLTGSDRRNLHYLLENVVYPSATLAEDFKLAAVQLKDGSTLSGTIAEKNPSGIVLQTLTERQPINNEDIEALRMLPVSLMPEGLLQAMPDDKVRNLSAYLMSDGPLNPASTGE